jgi:hypothetical protein
MRPYPPDILNKQDMIAVYRQRFNLVYPQDSDTHAVRKISVPNKLIQSTPTGIVHTVYLRVDSDCVRSLYTP